MPRAHGCLTWALFVKLLLVHCLGPELLLQRFLYQFLPLWLMHGSSRHGQLHCVRPAGWYVHMWCWLRPIGCLSVGCIFPEQLLTSASHCN